MIIESFQQYIIGIDIGTGSIKAVAMNSKGRIIADSQIFYSTQNPMPGYSEQDPEIIWKAFISCVKNIIDTIKYQPVSISFSSAMHGLIAVNKTAYRTGRGNRTISNLITWADTRSEKIAEQIRKSSAAKSIYKATGTPIHPMTPLCKIIWFRKNKPSVFKETFKFISIKEFVWHQLFGVYEIDHSIASATGLFNIKTLKWNKASLELCQINADQLSKPVPTDFIRKNAISSILSSLSLSSETSFCIGASDGCLANLGSYAIDKGTAALTIGTSGAVRIANRKPVFNFREMTFNYLLDDKTFICGGPVNNGGNVVQWLFEAFLNMEKPTEKDYENFFQQIDSIPVGSKGLIFLPYLNGERAPVWDGKASGVFFGIKPFHTQAYFLRAALEGICYSLNQVLEIVESSTSKIEKLIVSGGFIHSKTWMKTLADITGKQLLVIETQDSSAVGAALLNMKTMKMIKNYSSLKPKISQIVKPELKNHKKHEENYAVFKTLYPALKDSLHKIYQK
ncbi:MAG TPA: gluconokinase [Hanamia sp.]|nr:gluconokinase [Hanamia sp.]